MTDLAWPSPPFRQPVRLLPSPEVTLDAVADAMPIAYLLLDTDRRVLRCGGRSAPRLGLSPVLAVRKSIDEMFGPHDCIGEGVSAALSGVTHVTALTVNGFYFEFQFLPATHKVPFATVLATEITANVFWDQHKDGKSDGLITLNANRQIQSANRAAHRIFGYSSKELIGRNVTMLVPEFRGEEPTPMSISKTVGRRCDGSVIDISLSLSSLDDGDDPGQMATIVDISNPNVAQSTARRSAARYVLAALGASDGLWD